MVGLSLAAKLKNHNLKIVIIDPKAVQLDFADDYDLRVSAITRSTENWLKDIAAWSFLKSAKKSAYDKMQVWDGESTSGQIEFDAKSITEKNLGYIVENRELRSAIYQATQDPNIDFMFGEKCQSVSYQEDFAQLDLESGYSLQAKLLVAADGAFSWLRSASKIDLSEKPYGHKAIVATIRTELPHNQTAYQRFDHKGPLAFLPLNDQNHCSIVWSVQEDYAERLLALSEQEFIAQLANTFENKLGRLSLESQRLAFPLFERAVETNIQHRLALIGDAAHTIHPLAGQGVNLGFADAKELAETILNNQQKQKDIGALQSLRPYQRNRASDNLQMQLSMSAFKTLFEQKQPFIQTIRAFGLNTVNKLPLLKKQIIRRAMGL
ncbi:MAG: UbiH/UbiF/VisC/COQ6 family ubiquinone biosynthesis hydroxylase [Gammaproteobacteria bacterium]|nr:UbiH/UbiF/VisC/COQ6 family ubiquinone biosynthesis hydroxylase [Gammaproteobacteria bacterium]